MNIFLIIFSITSILLILPILIISIRSHQLNKAHNKTISYVKNHLGFIVSINGPIRYGKSSLQSGLADCSVRIIINDILDLIEQTRMIFMFTSFNELDNTLFCYYDSFDLSDKENYPDFDYIADVVINDFNLESNNYINNFIGNENVRKYILDYVQAIFVFYYRENYVQSKTPFYSHITKNYNLELNVDWLSIKEAYKNKDYAILDWVVILIDELTDEASAGLWQQDIKDIAGAKEYRRKFGQIHQERNRLITTKQDIMDEVKRYRNLTHSHLLLKDPVSTTGNYYFIYKFINKILDLILFIHKNLYLRIVFSFNKIFKKKNKDVKFIDYYEYYSKESNNIRNIGNYLYYIKQFLTSIGYNRYYGILLTRAEDIERSNSEADEFYFFIPTINCFGTYDTHLYKSMQSDLIKQSTTITQEVIPNLDPHFFEDEEDLENIDKGDDSFEFI